MARYVAICNNCTETFWDGCVAALFAPCGRSRAQPAPIGEMKRAMQRRRAVRGPGRPRIDVGADLNPDAPRGARHVPAATMPGRSTGKSPAPSRGQLVRSSCPTLPGNSPGPKALAVPGGYRRARNGCRIATKRWCDATTRCRSQRVVDAAAWRTGCREGTGDGDARSSAPGAGGWTPGPALSPRSQRRRCGGRRRRTAGSDSRPHRHG